MTQSPATDPQDAPELPTIAELMSEIHKLKLEATLRDSLIKTQSQMIAQLIETNQNFRAYIESAYINADMP